MGAGLVVVTVLMGTAIGRERMTDGESLVRCEIVFDEAVQPFSGATVYVRLEDVSRMDTAARVVVEQVLREVSYQPDRSTQLAVDLRGPPPDAGASYAVRVHVDVDDDGEVSPGDYISTQSYPVMTFGHPNQVAVRVRAVP